MKAFWPSWRAMIIDIALAVGAGAFDVFIFVTSNEPGNVLRSGNPLPRAVVVALFCVGAAALLFRRRWPRQVFVIAWVISMTPVVAPDLQPFGVLLVAMFTVSSTFSLRPAAVTLVATSIVFAVEIVNTAPAHGDVALWIGRAFATFFFDVVLVALVWIAARLRWRLARRVADIERRRRAEIDAAIRAERTSVSRDLHDIISHSVSAMTLQAAGAKAVMADQPERVRPALDAIEQTGVQAISELQRLLQVLRSTSNTPEPTRARDRLSQLPELIERARQAGQQVELEVTGDPCELDPSVELTCYRVIQEALNNASRHAGEGAEVHIRLDWLPPRLRTSVINGGGNPGTAGAGLALSTGHGLIGLAERVQLVGGELETGPLPDGGFRIEATLPVSAPPPDGLAVGRDATPGDGTV